MADFRVWDNGGRSFDRYTVFFNSGYALGIGDTGNVPNGFCMTVDAIEGKHLGEMIAFDDLPVAVQKAIEDELRLAAHTEAWRQLRADGSTRMTLDEYLACTVRQT